MERKIGEIFKHNGEWYQCVESDSCGKCSLRTTECGSGTKSDLADEVFGECSKIRRSDNKHVIFKKLEKVGEPFSEYNPSSNRVILFQRYKCYQKPVFNDNITGTWRYWFESNTIEIELKQNKENMENKKLFTSKSQDKENNLKPFNLEAAKAGKPVCTRDGRKARIICFDRNDLYPIIALIECEDGKEIIGAYSKEGQTEIYEIKGTNLMMLPEKKEGWVNIYALNPCYSSKEEAEANIDRDYEHEYVRTVKIEWEE